MHPVLCWLCIWNAVEPNRLLTLVALTWAPVMMPKRTRLFLSAILTLIDRHKDVPCQGER